MAFQKAFTHDTGAEFAKSYWRVAAVTINKDQRFAEVVFTGFVSKETCEAGKPSIGSRTFVVRDEQFDAGLAALLANNVNPLSLAYQVALSVKDVEGENGELISFFESAESV